MGTSASLLEELHFVNALPPVADAGNGTVSTDVISMRGAGRCVFVLQKGVGTTGTSTIKVEACDDFTPSTTEAVPFRYRNVTTGDTATALTEVAATGFTTTAGSNHIVLVEVDAADVGATGYPNVRLKATESADAAVLFGVLAILGDLRTSVDTGDTYIS